MKTKRVSEENVKPNLKKINSGFVNFEIPFGDYEVLDGRDTLNDLVKISVVTDDVTMKTILNINNTLRFEEFSLFTIQLGSAPIGN